jgi:hypothetical protein
MHDDTNLLNPKCSTRVPCVYAVQFLQYLQEDGIGLEVGVWDWTSGGFGSARWDFPFPEVSGFTGLSCHQKGYGLGKVASPDAPRANLQRLPNR